MARSKRKSKQAEVSPAKARFGRALSRERQGRGYSSAYSFFHDNGGKKHFGFTYLHYLFMERGVRMPSEASLRAILDTFGSETSLYDKRLDLLVLYVEAVLDGAPLFKPVFDALKKGQKAFVLGDSSKLDIQEHAQSQKITSVPRMRAEQVHALTSDPSAFWALQWLLQTGQEATLEELSRAVVMPADRLAEALKLLQEKRLVRKRGSGRYFAPSFKTDLFEPMPQLTPKTNLWLAERLQEKIRERSESHYYSYFLMALDDPRKIAVIQDVFRDAMSKSYLYRPGEPVDDGALVAVEARVARVLPIE